MLVKARESYNKFKNRFFLDHYESSFIRQIKKDLSKYKNSHLPKKNILIQMPEDYYYLACMTFVVKAMKEIFNIKLSWINLNCEYQRKSLIRRNTFFERKWTNLYQAHGGRTELSHLLYDKDKLSIYREKARKILNDVHSKESLVELRYDGVLIGDLVYDTYLRFRPAPTVDLKDEFLVEVLVSALHISDNTQEYFKNNQTDFLITSYCSYIQHGIPVRMALNHKIAVYSLGSWFQVLKKVGPEFPSHVKNYSGYKKTFDDLPEERKKEGIETAKDVLEKRLAGKSDFATSYMKTSAYTANDTLFLGNSEKPKLVFFLHCFFDSPHIYKSMIFPDFYEWLDQSLDFLKDKDYEIFLKPHPNGFEGNQQIISKFIAKYPFVKILPASANNKTLASEKFTAALTVHGTLAHEFTYLGIPVISAGDNPHSSFNFGIPVKSKNDYFQILGDLSKLRPISQIEKDEALAFVYIYSLHQNNSDKKLLDTQFFIENIIQFKTSQSLTFFSDKNSNQSALIQIIKNELKDQL